MGIPLHPLVIHGAVVFIPLAALCSIIVGIRPSWLRVLKWPTVALALLGAGFLMASRVTGQALYRSVVGARAPSSTLGKHAELVDLLAQVALPLFALMLLAAWFLPKQNGWAAHQPPRRSRFVELVSWLLRIALCSIGVGVIVVTILVGDAGARSVWGN